MKNLPFDLRLPVVAAPMFLISGPQLVLAACKAGIVGAFPTPNARPIEQLDQWMRQITEGLAAARDEHADARLGPWCANLVTHSSNNRLAEDLERMFALFPRLKERRDQLAGTLSGGEQQMLAMGRALMSRPQLLLLDEPSMGLSPLMVDKIFEVITDVSRQGVTVLLVEQNASRALQIADRAYVMESGLITLQGPAQQLLHDPQVQAAYLGQ